MRNYYGTHRLYDNITVKKTFIDFHRTGLCNVKEQVLSAYTNMIADIPNVEDIVETFSQYVLDYNSTIYSS